MDSQRDSTDAMRPVRCPCGKALRVRADAFGKQVRCPACRKIFVPLQSVAVESLAHSLSNSDPTQATLSSGGLKPHDPSESLVGFLMPPQNPDELGRLGGYRILKILGHGGMGVVYKAEDPRLGRFVAIKAMLPAVATSPAAVERFFREAKAAAAFKHDHIVSIFQVGEDRGTPFLAMEFLEGESLEARLKREVRLPLADTVRIGREVALGLAAAHKRGLIHRDIKPANVWLDSESGRAKILDFGLVRGSSEGDLALTQSGMIVGTPAYMPPEQAASQPIDSRCDLYSLGVVLYRMCTGELPIKGKDAISLLTALSLDTPVEPARLNSQVPEELNDLIMRLLAKRPEDRPGSAAELAETLAAVSLDVPDYRIRAKPAEVRKASRPMPVSAAKIGLPPLARRSQWLIIGASSLAVVLCAAALLLVLPRTHEPGPDVQGNGPHVDAAEESPYDRLRREDIPLYELKLAGGGDPAKAPPELVAVLGDGRFQHPPWTLMTTVLDASPDGKLIAAAAGEHAVRIWDAESGELMHWLPTSGQVEQVVFDPRGDRLFAVSGDVVAWDPQSGDPRPVPFTKKQVNRLSFSRDGALVAISGRDGRHSVVKIGDGSVLASVEAVWFSLLSPDGKWLAYSKNGLRFWNIAANKDEGLIEGTTPGNILGCFSSDSKTLMVLAGNGSWALCDVAARKAGAWKARALPGNPYTAHPSSDGRTIVVAGDEGYEIVNPVTGERVQEVKTGLSTNRVSTTPLPGERLAVFEDLLLGIRDKFGNRLNRSGDFAGISDARATRDGILAYHWDAQAFAEWDISTRKPRKISVAQTYCNFVVSERPKELAKDAEEAAAKAAAKERVNERKIIFGLWAQQRFKELVLLDVDSGAIKSLPATQQALRSNNSIAISPDGRRHAAACGDSVAIWEHGTSRVLKAPAVRVALTNEFLVAHDGQNKLTAYDLAKDQPAWSRDDGCNFLRASPDGRQVAVAREAQPAVIVDAKDGALRCQLPPSTYCVFSRDGRRIATLSAMSIGIWNTDTGDRQADIPLGRDKNVAALDFAPDDRHVIAAYANGVIHVYRLTAAGKR